MNICEQLIPDGGPIALHVGNHTGHHFAYKPSIEMGLYFCLLPLLVGSNCHFKNISNLSLWTTSGMSMPDGK
jgi:hypothetical protein